MSLLVVFSAGRFSPIQEPWVPGYLVSLALALSSYCLRHVQGVQLPLPLLFITPFASRVFLETSPSWVLTVSSAPDSEQRTPWVVLPARYPSSASSPSTLVASWSGGSGACLPFFPFPFPLEYSSLRGQWLGSWNGTSHRVVPLSALGLPCLCSSGGGH